MSNTNEGENLQGHQESTEKYSVPSNIHPGDRDAWQAALNEVAESDRKFEERKGHDSTSTLPSNAQEAHPATTGVQPPLITNLNRDPIPDNTLNKQVSRRNFIKGLQVGLAGLIFGGVGTATYLGTNQGQAIESSTPTNEPLPAPTEVAPPILPTHIEGGKLTPEVRLEIDMERPWSRIVPNKGLQELQRSLLSNNDDSVHTLKARYDGAQVRPSMQFRITKDGINPPQGVALEAVASGDGYRYELIDIGTGGPIWEHGVETDGKVDMIDAQPIKILRGTSSITEKDVNHVQVISEKKLEETIIKQLQDLAKNLNVYKANIKTVALSAARTGTKWSITYDNTDQVGAPERAIVAEWHAFNDPEYDNHGLITAAREGTRVVIENLMDRGSEYPQAARDALQRFNEHFKAVMNPTHKAANPNAAQRTLPGGTTNPDKAPRPNFLRIFSVGSDEKYISVENPMAETTPYQDAATLFYTGAARLMYDFDGYQKLYDSLEKSEQHYADMFAGDIINIFSSINRDQQTFDNLFPIPKELIDNMRAASTTGVIA